jgi:aspartate ammonia-lyase
MMADIRLLSSDINGQKEIEIPQKQVGSSIMPGKVNPVIPEFVISAVHKIYTNDSLISSLSGQGNLELNAYTPTIGHALLESLKLLNAANRTIKDNLITGLTVYSRIALERLYNSPSITTALSPYIGYNKASELAHLMKNDGKDIFQANKELGFVDAKKLEDILTPAKLLKLGYQLGDLIDD